MQIYQRSDPAVITHVLCKQPRTFKVPGLGQGTLATCAIASMEQNYGRIAAAPAAGNVTEVWLLVDCMCNSVRATAADVYAMLLLLPLHLDFRSESTALKP